MSPRCRIGRRLVGDGLPPFILAEAGINHNGDLERALAMISAAKTAGADAVKFQTFKADGFVGNRAQTFTYRSRGKTVTEPQYDLFKRLELPDDAWRALKRRCEKEGILFLSTPQNRSDLDLLLSVGIPAIKVGSDDFTNLPLLKDYASERLPMIVSCGMADLAEIRASLKAVNAASAVLLLCTSQYPTPPKDVNLRKLVALRREFPKLVLGFSDHTQGAVAASAAVALGACVFEKHFTLDHDLPGPDHWFAEDPRGLAAWVAAIRTAHQALGSDALRPTAAEQKMKILARRSIVALADIRKGERLDEKKLGLRRPGGGLPPAAWERVLGKTARRDIEAESLLRAGDFK